MVKENKSSKNRMCVVKRDGRGEPVHFDKITSRIQKLCYGLDMDFIDPPAITFKVINLIISKMKFKIFYEEKNPYRNFFIRSLYCALL